MSSELSIRKNLVSQARRVVIKLGTAVLMREERGIALSRFYAFVETIADIKQAKRDVLLVSSGAVGLGVERLGIDRNAQLLALKQACAAIGQGRLMGLYADAFDRLGVVAAQVLLTEEDFSNRRRFLNLRSTVAKLLELGALPIINENDTVSTAELETHGAPSYLKINFGDNDKLSALVASKIEADLLLILTDVEGLYTLNPSSSSAATLIPQVEEITPEIEALADSEKTAVGRGGMKTKLEAARIATQSGCAVIIASGKTPNVIQRIFNGEEIGTLFLPKAELSSKRKWIAFATTVKAALVVNEGAKKALVERKASLLAAGVIDVRGNFERGDVVGIIDEGEQEFARGIVNYSSQEARKISGLASSKIDELIENRNYDALITRDNIAIF
jgi:glutamate 5-kinase